MLRQQWEFEYKAGDVLKAARSKATHHRQRQWWWEKKQEIIKGQAQKRGLRIEESVGAGYSTSNVLRGAQLVVDESLQMRLSECHLKIKEHRLKKEEYESWVCVLSHRKESLKLQGDDYLYFFG